MIPIPARSAVTVLTRWQHNEAIPPGPSPGMSPSQGRPPQRDTGGAARPRVLLRDLATLRTDEPLFESVEALRWPGPTPAFEETARGLEARELWERAAGPRRHPERSGAATRM